MKMTNPFSIYNKKIQETKISELRNCIFTDTKEVWFAKMFQYKNIEQFNMSTVVQFNQEIFMNMRQKEKQHVLYLKEIVQNKETLFFIFQKFTYRLSQYIRNTIISKQEVEQILIEIFKGISQIYEEDYIVKNLCPQNIVFSDSEQKWKIQSLVFDCQEYDVEADNQYRFKKQWASNQEKQNLDNLDDNLADQQIVWNLGILALRLTLGSSFKINNIFKDLDLNLELIKSKSSPKVYELISKSIKARQRDRIQLSQFFKLSIFQTLKPETLNIQKFSSSSKIWKNKSQIIKKSAIQKSQIRQSTVLKKPKITQSVLMGQKPQILEENIKKFQNIYNWQLQKCLFFAQIKKYTNQSLPLSVFSNDDSSILRYSFTKISQLNLKILLQELQSRQLKQFSQTASYKNFIQDVKSQISAQQRLCGTLFNKLSKISNQKLKAFASQNQTLNLLKNQEISIEQLSKMINKIAGIFYSSLKSNVDNQKQIEQNLLIQRQRILCYIVFAICIIYQSQNSVQDDFSEYRHNFQQQKLRNSLSQKGKNEQQKCIQLLDYIQNQKIENLINHSQRLLNKYFQIQKQNEKENQAGKH